jgi:ABC-type transporter Mla MlaB component
LTERRIFTVTDISKLFSFNKLQTALALPRDECPSDPTSMTLKIERFSRKRGTRLRLSGELRSEQLDDLRAEIERGGTRVTLDLDEVNLVDIDAVRFLRTCEAGGIKVVNCSAYIREWMNQERRA